MSTSTSDVAVSPDRLKRWAIERALEEGFDVARVTRPDAAPDTGTRFDAFLEAGHHGTMEWMATTAERRRAPRALWPDVRSILVLGLNYGPDHDPLDDLKHRDRGMISVYARADDYHDIVKKKLKAVARDFATRTGADVKVFVDTAPVMEKPLGQAAGVGWQGKHTNLVSRELGSWLFLGEIFTTAELPADEPEADHCGSCRACLDICPTGAFPAPYRLDARRCISYLTIEHAGPIPRELRPGIGNRIYGCDDCLAVCPWNKFAVAGNEMKLQARPDLSLPALADLSRLDDTAFRALFTKSPVKRIRRDRFLRNVLIAIGNSGETGLAACARDRLDDEAPVVRGAAVWALSRLLPGTEFAALAEHRQAAEQDPSVREEWQAALTGAM
ncbi:tRNA epoxyqueuosine(34) reductase QueG [Microbaculum marinisediminis]|uniref:Epoxyqueuosine reductase n=1 Tax=Microbaculum marinisediminis TaxID=2931392 RepID=A0AAW5QSC4_9HYPH|nr:tRNA epoxyqueuosine(34) reductase QueG [Microbaculum sp. A6E488]MCT8970860.1 tRNA epoxyqueuosine(34) reductase QueG [Microbaculum sp. A6E488]